MDAWIYRGGQTVWDDEHRPIRLEYYLQREVRDVRTGTCIYGIRVEQYREIGERSAVRSTQFTFEKGRVEIKQRLVT